MNEFALTSPAAPKKPRVRRGGWSWGPVEGAKLRTLSFGGGIQSTTLVEMMIAGVLPWVDAIIYAENNDGQRTREHVARMEERVRQASNYVQFLRVGEEMALTETIRARSTGDRGFGSGKRFVAAPFFTSNGGQGRRQCTREFKTEPLERRQRDLLGYKPRQRIPARSCEVWIGISTDEVVRAGAAFAGWVVNRYPLLEMRMSRQDCVRWLSERGLRVPPKSACIFCPYRSDSEWRWLRDNDPEGWAEAVEIDRLIRSTPGMRELEFLHSSRQPLAEVDLSTAAERGHGMLMVCEAGCGL
ncbi:hypothetical protein [Chelatococcus sp. XZ-Ab1]|uniref:hypothetical protein n=1 Tax=Chelatococcus sp. XZ-Ab1 TaxID=3034027 RepID=UPI0023E3A6F0|nr:hypothetical protein [Chelatococcus sp. XZ-Ab1]